jgi:hypothetical protein
MQREPFGFDPLRGASVTARLEAEAACSSSFSPTRLACSPLAASALQQLAVVPVASAWSLSSSRTAGAVSV